MQTAVVDGILEGLEVSQDKEKDLVIISGSIPQNVGDRVLAIRVTAKGNNNDAEASATIDVMGHLIETIRIDASTTVHLGHLPRGKALLKVSGRGFAEIMQVVVK